MPEEGKNILKYRPEDKSLKVQFIIYADLECLLKKEQSCQNNSKNFYAEKKATHKSSGYSLSLNCSFDETKSQRKFYRKKDLIEIINYEEKEMIPLTDNETKFYEEQKVCHICKGKFCYDKNKKSKYDLNHKVRDHCHYTRKFSGAAHNICNFQHKVSKKSPVVFHNGSAYDYHFIIKN